jgi:predicted NUDIX family NTP pyrophosphohydrolase
MPSLAIGIRRHGDLTSISRRSQAKAQVKRQKSDCHFLLATFYFLLGLGSIKTFLPAATTIWLVSMSRISAGLLMYRIYGGTLQVLLAHPGGPFFKNKDEGAWSIPKGEVEPGEEFEEETGITPKGPFIALTPITQKGGKIVHAWAFEDDCDPSAIVSNTFTIEWPPKSGQQMDFPEIDRADFFDVAVAKRKVKAAQAALIEELEGIVKGEA